MQRYINSTREALIWGENDGLAKRVVDALRLPDHWRNQMEEQRRAKQAQGDRAWIALLNPEPDLTGILRKVLQLYYADATARLEINRWGFKEIRHGSDVASMLLEAFPDGRVIHLIRHPRACLASISGAGWLDHWGGPKLSIERWKKNCDSVRNHADPRALTIRLEDFEVAPEKSTNALSEHLGIAAERFDADLLSHVVRGAAKPPTFGPKEEALLDDPDVHYIAEHFGYKIV